MICIIFVATYNIISILRKIRKNHHVYYYPFLILQGRATYMKQHHYLFLYILLSYSLFSQSADRKHSFDSIYNKLAREKTDSNTDSALKTADSLYKIAQNDIQRIQSQMITSQLLQQKGKKDQAIQIALKAYDMAQDNKNNEWQAKILGLLSSLYRDSGLNEKGKEYLHKALEVSKKIVNKDESYRFQGNVYQELSYYSKNEQKITEAITNLKKGNLYFEKISDVQSKNFLLATNMELLGSNFFSLKQIDSSLYYYNKGLEHLNRINFKESPLTGFIYNGLGEIYLYLGMYEKAIDYLHKAYILGEESDFFALKEKNYLILMRYYKQTGNQKEYLTINEKYLALTSQLEIAKKNTTDTLIRSLNDQEKKSQKKLLLLTSIISLLIIVIVVSFYIYHRKRKRDFLNFEKILLTQEANKKVENQFLKVQPLPSETTNMALETEERLLKELESFEKKHLFLSENISLASLAVQFNTNTKYLSYILRKQYHKDFSTYINELKINYILEKLKKEKKYRQYKISYMASECGFSTHSKFTSVFRQIAGITPSKYIKYLQDDKL